jgi:hypothetical protein
MEDKSCQVFVDGKECGRELILVNLEGKKIARYDLATYECNGRHRTYFLLEPRLEGKIDDTPRDRGKDGQVSAGIPRHSRPGNPRRDVKV